MALGSILVRLSMNTADFETDAGRAAKVAQRRAKEIDSAFKKAGVAIGVALGAAAVAVGAAVKSAIDQADHLNDINQRLGVSAEALSGWGYAALQTGTDIDALGVGLKKLAKNMADALDPKSEQSRIFKQLGVEITDANGKLRDVESVLPEVADRFKSLDNATLESALAMDLFGKSGTDLLEFLNQGSHGLAKMRERARELGVEVSGDTMRAADEFNDTLGDIKVIANGLALRLADALLPSLQDTAEYLRDGAIQGGEFGGIFEFIRDEARATVKDIEIFTKWVRDLGEMVDDAFKPRGGPALERWKQLHQFDNVTGKVTTTQHLGRFSPAYEEASLNFNPGTADLEARLGRAYGGTDGKTSKRKAGKSDAQKWAEDAAKAAKEAADAQARWHGTILDMEATLAGPMAEAQREYERNVAQLNADYAEGHVTLADYARGLDAYAASRDKELEAIKARKTPAEEMLADLADEYRLLGINREEQEKFLALKHASVDAWSEEGQAITDWIEKVQGAREARQLLDGVQDSMGDMLASVLDGSSSVGDAFEDMFDSIKRQAAAFLAEKAIQKLFDWLFGSASGASGGGGFLSGLFGGGRASGGPVSGSRLYEVGEGGKPEMFQQGGRTYLIPGNDGRVIPATAGLTAPAVGDGGGSTYVNVINNSGQPAQTTERMDGLNKIIDVVIGEVDKRIASNGSTGKVIGSRFGLQPVGVARG